MRLLFLNIILILCIFLSCKGDFDVFIPDEENPVGELGDINQLFATVGPIGEKFNWDASEDLQVRTQNQLLLSIPANAISDQQGRIIEGKVEVEIQEVYTKGNLLLNSLHTTTDEQIIDLESGLFIALSKDGEVVQLTPEKSITVDLITQDQDEDIQLFFGEKEAGKFNWVASEPSQSISIELAETLDPATNVPNAIYRLKTNRLGWIALGKVSVRELTGQPICLNLSEDYQPTNTAAYAVFEDINALVRLKWSDIPEASQFCWENVPNIEKATFFVISEWRKGIYHVGTKEYIMDLAIQGIDLEMKETTIEDILELISGL